VRPPVCAWRRRTADRSQVTAALGSQIAETTSLGYRRAYACISTTGGMAEGRRHSVTRPNAAASASNARGRSLLGTATHLASAQRQMRKAGQMSGDDRCEKRYKLAAMRGRGLDTGSRRGKRTTNGASSRVSWVVPLCWEDVTTNNQWVICRAGTHATIRGNKKEVLRQHACRCLLPPTVARFPIVFAPVRSLRPFFSCWLSFHHV
jgi:hypothetical protein